MSDHKHNQQEFPEPWDTGTYQTGSIKAPRGGRLLVAALLVAVIFLGGIISAMGLINIRLLEKLTQTPNSTMPMSKDTSPATTTSTSPLENNDDEAPSIPTDRVVDLDLLDTPYYNTNASQNLTPEQIYSRNAASLVEVYCETHFNSIQTGIGTVLTSDGYILTNSHVVEGTKRIFVYLPEGELTRAALVGTDPFTDLAVLYIERTDLTPAVFSSTRNLQIMDPTYAVESLDDNTDFIRKSSVFSIGQTLSTEKRTLTLLQTITGSNAGPVFNSQGQIIGLQAGKIARYFRFADTRGLGLVIPSGAIRSIVLELTSNGFVSDRPELGVEVEAISKLYQHYWDLPGGMLLTYVDPQSNAASQGLQEGDILLALDGKPLKERDDLYTILYNKNIGDSVTAVVLRNEQTFTMKLTIEEATE